jgi:hypothetical protein
MACIKHYLRRSSNLCLFDVGKISPDLFFPRANIVTVIHCEPAMISALLQPAIFPRLDEIHYLSADPGSMEMHRRFSRVKWLFPNVRHAFYRNMIEAGYGRVENRLIRTYVHDFQNGAMQLNLPGYGMVYGDWYRQQLQKYLSQPIPADSVPHEFSYLMNPDHPFEYGDPHVDSGGTEHSLHAFLQQKREKEVMDYLLKK